MKFSTLFAFVLVGTVTASTAFASHAYRSEDCSSAAFKFSYKGNYPIGGSYGLSKINSDKEIELWDKKNADDSSANQFVIEDNKVISSQEAAAPCQDGDDVDFTETTSQISIKVKLTKVSGQDAQALEVKLGDVLSFQCVEIFSVPVHCQNK
jgi:hypothetical protein